jgi:hypothetical protein
MGSWADGGVTKHDMEGGRRNQFGVIMSLVWLVQEESQGAQRTSRWSYFEGAILLCS